ncbi:MAG: tetratricopeptide repeat protein [Myxococcales bacterium]|nr:tetratricopeptide repeat protein [Myxococcales bacterium]
MNGRGADGGVRRRRLGLAWLFGFVFLGIVALHQIGHPSRLARVLLAKGHPRAAALAGRWGTISSPEDPRAWFVLGEALRAADRPADAAAAYEEAAARTDEGALLTRVGEAFRGLGRADEAVAAWKLAIAHPHGRVDDALDALTELLIAQKRGDEALPILADAESRAAGKGVMAPSAAGNRAVVLARMGRADEARRAIGDLSTRFPQIAIAAFKSAEALAILGDRGEALAGLERARERPFHHPCWMEIKLDADTKGPGAFADLRGDARFAAILRWAADWRSRRPRG